MTLQTAYLKAKYPVEFFCALLNQKRDNYGAINKYIIDSKKFGVEILPPNINKSDREFSISDGKILFGLEAIKDVGITFVDQIMAERSSNGDFKNFKDFCERMSPSKKIVIALTKAGAIPCKNKRMFLLSYAKSQYEVKEYSDVKTMPKLSILREKFGIDTDVIKDKEERLKLYNEKRRVEFNEQQVEKYNAYMQEFSDKYLQNESIWEFEALSIFIDNNPFEKAYEYISKDFADVENGEEGVIVGIIASIQKKKDRHGKQFAFLWMYSAFGLIEATCWHTQLKQYEDLIKRGNQLALLCKKSDDKAIVKEIKTYSQWIADRRLEI